MNKIILLIKKITNIKFFFIVLSLYLVVFGNIVYTLSELTQVTNGIGILDFEVGYSKDKVIQMLSSYGSKGFELYSRIQLLDIVNPLLYSTIMTIITYLLWRKQQILWPTLLPLIAGAFDYLENITIFFLIKSFPNVSETLVSLSSMLSIIKNIVMFSAVSAMIVGLFFLYKNRIKK